MRKIICLFLISMVFLGCAVEAKLIFREHSLSHTKHAIIDINYPKAEGNDDVSNAINATIENYIAEQINMGDDTLSVLSLEDAVDKFDNEFKTFKGDFPDSAQKWEALIDSEVTYESVDLICVAVNSYLDTGGAHGNSYIEFLNFDPVSGNTFNISNMINDIEGFTKIVEQFYIEETKTEDGENQIEDSFFGKGFQLPETLGFSDDGIIILYNTYETASYAQGIIEFTIQFEDVNPFLKFQSML